jgi:hypothetical protein
MHQTSEENTAGHGSWGTKEAGATPVPSEKVKAAAKAGLAAAAIKAKLFADHEEREIQRLSANIVNHQVHLLLLFFWTIVTSIAKCNCFLLVMRFFNFSKCLISYH